ncbi:Transcription initiation factor TFIID subunit 11 [Thelohanellus kitauei]|uniref:Transcription initiation factor TFIID subunit 11 n=1 Tax=Thelohanellus kitauei TaxID=669202 RepID=A0A0C2MII9_THEKT|nr:Transcription initiation factor TFIID subunit 11 [Thelohanellus kitauei]
MKFGDEDKFMSFWRVVLPKNKLKKLMNSVVKCNISPESAMVLAAISKIFIGEIIEEALNVAKIQKWNGPLQPRHVAIAVDTIMKKEPYFRPKLKQSFEIL